MIQVSVVSGYPSFQKNQVFLASDCLAGPHAGNDHWLEPGRILHEKAKTQGIKLDTADLVPIETADVALFWDLPPSREELRRLRAAAPRTKFVLMIVESPLNRAHAFHRENHRLFDGVITYDRRLVDGIRYFPFNLPLPRPFGASAQPSFEQRKIASMISTNQNMNIRLRLRFLRAARRAGWAISWKSVAEVFRSGELYSERRALAKAFVDAGQAGALDIFGSYWETSPCARGVLQENKFTALPRYRFNICYENCVNDCGYVSEKLFDALYAGTVPVYRGNESIREHVPVDCFVDARSFRGQDELVRFLLECPKAQWEGYLRAGREFLASTALAPFLPDAYVENVVRAVRAVFKAGGHA